MNIFYYYHLVIIDESITNLCRFFDNLSGYKDACEIFSNSVDLSGIMAQFLRGTEDSEWTYELLVLISKFVLDFKSHC